MFASCFQNKGKRFNAVWNNEQEQKAKTEIKTTISVLKKIFKKIKYIYIFFENRKPKSPFWDEENRKPNGLPNFQTVASLITVH